MPLFSFSRKPKETKFQIDDSDRENVIKKVKSVISYLGFPKPGAEQYLFDATNFSQTFSSGKISIEHLIADLTVLYSLSCVQISYELIEDVRDIENMPRGIQGKAFDSETQIIDNGYRIFLAKSLEKQPDHLVYCLVNEFAAIRLLETKMFTDMGGYPQLVYHTAIYFGFGLVLNMNLMESFISSDSMWVRTWKHIPPLSIESIAFSLAIYAHLTGNNDPDWGKSLPNELKVLFEKACIYLTNPSVFEYNKSKLEFNHQIRLAIGQYKRNNFEAALEILRSIEIIELDEKESLTLYNYLGYYSTRNCDLEESISYYRKVIEINLNYQFACDNLGYALIRLGKLDEGKEFVEMSMRIGNNNNAYSYRNLALYHHKKGNIAEAKENFESAFREMKDSVDLLEYHYGDFLLDIGEREKGLEFIKKAVEKGEPEAVFYESEMR